ncbi:hypothetical protein [Capnocytophaga sp.]|uniref:hypothetical protein n=1 Tax=Capnocytophaga sp. TaxID=44737 RepID=UPI0026DDB6C0|nr:hypothetical protein [Capnocytophaga sp.]MDO5106079.1 hypothetical protein [Capnocytophaga sp.]
MDVSKGKFITYTYDTHGNIKTKTEVPINPKTNQPIHQSDNSLIGYRKSIKFIYNPNNELQKTITITDIGRQVQRTTTCYHYDAFGRRIAKHAKTEKLHKLNQQGKLVRYPTTLLHLRKTDKTEHSTMLMLWEGNKQIQEYTKDFVFTTVYDDESFEPVARAVQSYDKDCEKFKIYHYLCNHLGTPQELTNNKTHSHTSCLFFAKVNIFAKIYLTNQILF